MKKSTFTLSTDTTDIPLIVTQNALDDFRDGGLEAMDKYLLNICERFLPVNIPHKHVSQLGLVGQMMLEALSTDNSRKLMLCALWIAHHYPNVLGLVSSGDTFHFITRENTFAATPIARVG